MPSFASPLNLALVLCKIQLQLKRPRQPRRWGGGGSGLGHPASVWEVIKPLILSDFIMKQASEQHGAIRTRRRV